MPAQTSIPFTHYEAGLYLIVIRQGNETTCERIMKIR
jgi:hypothetical protein